MTGANVKCFDTFLQADDYAKKQRTSVDKDAQPVIFIVQYTSDYTDAEMTDLNRTIRTMPQGEIDPSALTILEAATIGMLRHFIVLVTEQIRMALSAALVSLRA